jgi:hypothetical protein
MVIEPTLLANGRGPPLLEKGKGKGKEKIKREKGEGKANPNSK